jgi:FkbM family methyltransferase
MKLHHPVFEQFPAVTADSPRSFIADFIGSSFNGGWDGQADAPAIPNHTPSLPGFDEEYFEWIDILESVCSAADSHVFIELGAGYGRWSVRAGLAARLKGLRPRLLLVEGHPRNAQWAREALALNRLEREGSVIEAAIAYTGEAVTFVVSHEERELMFDPCVAWDGATENGWGTILVPSTTLEEVTRPFERIDLIDMDLQRAERDLVRHSMETLNRKVKRVHIGTHLPEIETELRDTFTKFGWRNVWDFACGQINETPYGAISFVDGVQGWINPRFD